jgi:hypothetical protein
MLDADYLAQIRYEYPLPLMYTIVADKFRVDFLPQLYGVAKTDSSVSLIIHGRCSFRIPESFIDTKN